MRCCTNCGYIEVKGDSPSLTDYEVQEVQNRSGAPQTIEQFKEEDECWNTYPERPLSAAEMASMIYVFSSTKYLSVRDQFIKENISSLSGIPHINYLKDSYKKRLGRVCSGRIKSAALLFDDVVIPVHHWATLSASGMIPAETRSFIYSDAYASTDAFLAMSTAFELAKSGGLSPNFFPFNFRVDMSQIMEGLDRLLIDNSISGESEGVLGSTFEDVMSIIVEDTFQENILRNNPGAVCLWKNKNSEEYFSEPDEGESIDKATLWKAALSNIPVVVESRLDWKQVMEFRSDTVNRKKYRDLRIWLEDGLKASSSQQAEDLISQRIDDYSVAVKKHGLGVAHGTITALVDPKSIAAGVGSAIVTSATIFSSPLISIGVAGGAYLAGVGIKLLGVKAKTADKSTLKGREVAYLHSIIKNCN